MRTDSDIRQDVMDELKWNPGIDEPGIGVSVKDGVVTLTGTVGAFAEKKSAENAARRIRGVRAIVQEITVSLASDHKRADQEIADAALTGLRWHASIPKDKIMVKVEHGRITLEGNVEWNYQREAAQHVVENLAGVVGVENKIEIKSAVKPKSVKENIRHVFERNALLDADKINVIVNGHKVILEGTVQSWDEQRQACQAAWSSPGVLEIENRLEIKPRVLADIIDK